MTIRTRLRGLSATLLRYHAAVHRRVDRVLSKPVVVAPYRLRPYRPDAPRRIVHVNGNFLVGGSTQLIVDIIERLSDEYRHEVVVPDAPAVKPYQPVVLHEVPLEAMASLFESLAADRPVAVHVHFWVRAGDEFHPVALWYDAIFRMCERLAIPVVQNVNVPTVPHPSLAVVHNVFVSGYVRDAYDPALIPSSVIYPWSDFAHFTATDTDAPGDVIGMVYRLDRDKLDERAIEVFIAAVRRRPTLHCLIVGGGHYLDLYRRRVAEAGQSGNFSFPGFVSYTDLPSWYRKLSLFVAPVHNESFGQVTPFAMSMGLPVAGFDVGALAEQLGGTATLAPAGDVERLAAIIVELCTDRDARLALGRANARRAHERFSVGTMISHYRALYRNVAAESGAQESRKP